MREPAALLGAGALGTSLGLLLARADWPLVGVSSRTHSRALEATLLLGCPAFPDPAEPVSRSGIVLLAVPSRELPEAWRRLAPTVPPGALVAHTGVEGPEALAGAELPLSFRPLGFVESPDEAETVLRGAFVALEGPPEAVRRGSLLAEAVGLRPVPLSGERRLKALAATFLGPRAEGYRLWGEAGLEGTPPAGPPPPSCEADRAWLARLLEPVDPSAARLLAGKEESH